MIFGSKCKQTEKKALLVWCFGEGSSSNDDDDSSNKARGEMQDCIPELTTIVPAFKHAGLLQQYALGVVGQ